jgi:hypothetical protein
MSGSRRLSLLFLAALAAAGGAAVSGCPTLPDVVPCGQIPPGGCPLGRGGSCEDTSCDIIYACVDAVWVSSQVCARTGGGAGGGGGGGPVDAGPCTPVVVTAKNEGQNCTPDLQAPDCPIEAAGQCLETACLSGCVDFFVCGSDQTWKVAAFCDDGGDFVGM